MSQADDFLESTRFEDYLKEREDRSKVMGLLFGRFDAVIKGIGGLGNVMAKRRR